MSTEYKDKISVWMDDKGYDIPGHLTDDEGNDFDLTGYTVVVRGSEPDAANMHAILNVSSVEPQIHTFFY